MKPVDLKTKVFLDSGDPKETQAALDMLGFLDGQTTNPSLISKNPKVIDRISHGKKFTRKEILDFYKDIILEISSIIPDGDISIEIYANKDTKASEMIEQVEQMSYWIKNGRVKLPTNLEGLKAAEILCREGIKINMTLCFSQQQAAGVYAATLNSKFKVYVSPFQGRLNDIGLEGLDLIKNTINMFHKGDHHVEVLAASIRDLPHFLYSLYLNSDIITAPLKVLKEWYLCGMKIPNKKDNKELFDEEELVANSEPNNESNLKRIPYEEIDLNKELIEYNLNHPLTDAGIEKFTKDWDALII